MKRLLWSGRLYSVVLLVALAPITARAVSMDTLYVSLGALGGTGPGSIVKFDPGGTQTTFASGVDTPRGLTFDSTGNLFVATTSFSSSGVGQGTVLKFNSAGTRSNFGSVPGNTFLEGIATNPAGNVFVMAIDLTSPTLASTVFKFTPGGTRSTFGSTPGQGFGLVFNSAGNLFAADDVDNTIFQFGPSGVRSAFATGVGSSTPGADTGPGGELAFDNAGNLFVSVAPGIGSSASGEILEFTPAGIESVFATGLVAPRGLAFDQLGNLFATDLGTGEILEFTPTGAESVFASGLPGPEFLTFGPAGVPDWGATFGLLAMSTFGLLLVRRVAKV